MEIPHHVRKGRDLENVREKDHHVVKNQEEIVRVVVKGIIATEVETVITKIAITTTDIEKKIENVKEIIEVVVIKFVINLIV
jgi:hypothetical protein